MRTNRGIIGTGVVLSARSVVDAWIKEERRNRRTSRETWELKRLEGFGGVSKRPGEGKRVHPLSIVGSGLSCSPASAYLNARSWYSQEQGPWDKMAAICCKDALMLSRPSFFPLCFMFCGSHRPCTCFSYGRCVWVWRRLTRQVTLWVCNTPFGGIIKKKKKKKKQAYFSS